MFMEWTNPWGDRVSATLTAEDIKILQTFKMGTQANSDQTIETKLRLGKLNNWDLLLQTDEPKFSMYSNLYLSGLGEAVLKAAAQDKNRIDLDEYDCPLCEAKFGSTWRRWKHSPVHNDLEDLEALFEEISATPPPKRKTNKLVH